MAFASSTTDIVASAIESRRGKFADNVTKNNALLLHLKEKGRVLTISGGSSILEELSFAENGNASYYSGADKLPTGPQDVLSAAQFTLKQAACSVSLTGLESLQVSGKEEKIDLLASRLEVAESTMQNIITQGLYSDGTIYNGKSLIGLDAAVEALANGSQTSTYGGISRTTYSFWRSQCVTVTADISSAAKVQAVMNGLYVRTLRGADKPDFGIMDNNYWADWMASLQALQRFVDTKKASLGFPTADFMGADIYADGAIGGFATTTATTGTFYLLNSKYLKFRPHKDRNFVPLNPNRRYAVDQDVEVALIGFAGALTCSGAQFQGRSVATTI